jgi:hypothetical protein
MAVEKDTLRDWHRLFGLLLTDYFTGSPFTVEVERDLSQQQQLLDVVILRRGRGRFVGRLPDGLDGLVAHKLITFKCHREALDGWAMKELIGHYVAYRKLVSPTPSELLPEDQFRLYAVCARFPQNLSGQVPWQHEQPGVYHCQWGTDAVRVIVAGNLPREAHNAPLHLFSASPELVAFGRGACRKRSETTSQLLGQLFERFKVEGFAMYTMEDFKRDYNREQFLKLTPEKQQEILESLPLERRLAGASAEQIQHYLDQVTAATLDIPCWIFDILFFGLRHWPFSQCENTQRLNGITNVQQGMSNVEVRRGPKQQLVRLPASFRIGSEGGPHVGPQPAQQLRQGRPARARP